MTPLDNFYEKQEAPIKDCLLALRDIILQQDEQVSAAWKYGMPMFCYKGKMFCYLWVHKKLHRPYIGFVEGKYFDEEFLIQEKRSRMKIMMLDPLKDLPLKSIVNILQKCLDLYRKGVVKVGK